MTEQAADWVVIRSNSLTAGINPLGAQLSALQDQVGRDLLWNGDPAFWTGRAPLLFPIVGALAGGAFQWRGQRFALPRHGFARNKLFRLIRADIQSAQFQLRTDEQTTSVYPFEFVLDVQFTIHGSSLSMRVSVHNQGAKPMPASLGFHPAFRWPLPYGQPRAAHRILFERDETERVRRLDAQGLLEPATRPTPVRGRVLALDDALFAQDALILDRVQSRSLLYGAPIGPQISVAFPDTPYLGLWSKPQAPFVCIEPWHGIADPQGFSGDFDQKPGIFTADPGGTLSFSVNVTLMMDGAG